MAKQNSFGSSMNDALELSVGIRYVSSKKNGIGMTLMF